MALLFVLASPTRDHKLLQRMLLKLCNNQTRAPKISPLFRPILFKELLLGIDFTIKEVQPPQIGPVFSKFYLKEG